MDKAGSRRWDAPAYGVQREGQEKAVFGQARLVRSGEAAKDATSCSNEVETSGRGKVNAFKLDTASNSELRTCMTRMPNTGATSSSHLRTC